MSSRDINDLCAELQPLAKEFLAQCQAQGINVHIDCTYRSGEEQDEDYAKGVTKAKAGQSAHNCVDTQGNPAARAFDIYIQAQDSSLLWDTSDPLWQETVQIGEKLGLISGSTFSDIVDFPHFELPNWKNGAIFNIIPSS